MNTRTLSTKVDTLLRRLHQILSVIEGVGICVAAIGILLMMVFTTIDVALRYVIGSPLVWWYDFLMNYVIIAAFYLAFSYTLAHHGHLVVDFFANKMPRPLAFLALSMGFLVTSILFFCVGISSVQESLISYTNNDVQAGVILWPVWITKALVASGMLTLALRSLHFSICYFMASMDASCLYRIGIVPGIDDELYETAL